MQSLVSFDQYDLMLIYAETRKGVDMEKLECMLQKERELALEIKALQEELRLEGETDMKCLEQMAKEDCE